MKGILIAVWRLPVVYHRGGSGINVILMSEKIQGES